VVEGGLLGVLVDVLSWPKPVASFVAAEVLILAKFVIADRWVFNHPSPTWDRLLRYQGAAVGALVVYWLVFNGLDVQFGMPYQVAFVVGTGAAFAWSLLTNFLWVWAVKTPPGSGQPAE
jgi:putative flippase GtrA